VEVNRAPGDFHTARVGPVQIINKLGQEQGGRKSRTSTTAALKVITTFDIALRDIVNSANNQAQE
jgi:hypothetical protein